MKGKGGVLEFRGRYGKTWKSDYGFCHLCTKLCQIWGLNSKYVNGAGDSQVYFWKFWGTPKSIPCKQNHASYYQPIYLPGERDSWNWEMAKPSKSIYSFFCLFVCFLILIKKKFPVLP